MYGTIRSAWPNTTAVAYERSNVADDQMTRATGRAQSPRLIHHMMSYIEPVPRYSLIDKLYHNTWKESHTWNMELRKHQPNKQKVKDERAKMHLYAQQANREEASYLHMQTQRIESKINCSSASDIRTLKVTAC